MDIKDIREGLEVIQTGSSINIFFHGPGRVLYVGNKSLKHESFTWIKVRFPIGTKYTAGQKNEVLTEPCSWDILNRDLKPVIHQDGLDNWV